MLGDGSGNIDASFNSGAILGSAESTDIGGLIGDAGATTISDAYNTGAITATGTDIGGLIGEGGSSIFIENSYNTGGMSITGDYSGLVGPGYAFTATSVYTDLVASASSATSYSETALADMKELTLYSGWDFDTIWGFGSCGDNNGLPMLRQLAQGGTYFGYSCGLDAAAVGNPVASNPAVYSGPTLDSKQSVIAGEQVSFTGRRLHYVSSAYGGTTKLTIVSGVSERLVLDVSSSMAAGSYDLVLFSSHGKLTFQQGLTITAPVAEVTPPAVIEPEAVKKLTVGSFKGFIAIYSKGYEGAKLSAKVAGKWQVVDGLDESFKGKNYSRTVRFTGAGYDILVHLYINGELIKTEELTTK